MFVKIHHRYPPTNPETEIGATLRLDMRELLVLETLLAKVEPATEAGILAQRMLDGLIQSITSIQPVKPVGRLFLDIPFPVDPPLES